MVNSMVEKIKEMLVEESGCENWNEFVDGQTIGDCQSIVSSINRSFPSVKKVFGEIEIDFEYIDEKGEEQNLVTHHWVEIDGETYDFSKGSLQNHIDWNEKYSVEVFGDEWRYRTL